jgi:hypothetical protein
VIYTEFKVTVDDDDDDTSFAPSIATLKTYDKDQLWNDFLKEKKFDPSTEKWISDANITGDVFSEFTYETLQNHIKLGDAMRWAKLAEGESPCLCCIVLYTHLFWLHVAEMKGTESSSGAKLSRKGGSGVEYLQKQDKKELKDTFSSFVDVEKYTSMKEVPTETLNKMKKAIKKLAQKFQEPRFQPDHWMIHHGISLELLYSPPWVHGSPFPRSSFLQGEGEEGEEGEAQQLQVKKCFLFLFSCFGLILCHNNDTQ